MSDVVVARAPGKLFLLGEYAVLDGCPAVVAAINRHIEVRLELAAGAAVIRICAPACGAVEFAAAQPPASEGLLRFVIAAYRAVLSRFPQLGKRGCSLMIASAMAGPDAAKVGLGSSAAVTVAAVAALAAFAGAGLDRHAIFAIAFEAHRAAQHGIGSGADVAASAYGGVVLFQPHAQAAPGITPLALPEAAELLAAWSGDSASTADLVEQYLAARNGSAAARAAFVAESHIYIDSFVGALRQGVLSHAAIDGAADALARLGQQLGLPIVTPRLAQLIALARAQGAAAKTSGAGGGDCGIALVRDAADAERVRKAWHAAHLVPLDVALDPTGVTVARR